MVLLICNKLHLWAESDPPAKPPEPGHGRSRGLSMVCGGVLGLCIWGGRPGRPVPPGLKLLTVAHMAADKHPEIIRMAPWFQKRHEVSQPLNHIRPQCTHPLPSTAQAVKRCLGHQAVLESSIFQHAGLSQLAFNAAAAWKSSSCNTRAKLCHKGCPNLVYVHLRLGDLL